MNHSGTTRLRRVGAGVALGALVAGSQFATIPPAAAATVPATVRVRNADIRPDESSYAGWHQGYDKAAYASAITADGLESIGRSQILYGYANNTNADLAADGVNADLSDDLVGASYEVKSGRAYLQVPLFADLDGAGPQAPVFATLRPAEPAEATTKVAAGDQWVTSRALGDIAANTPMPLSGIIAAIEAGTYKTIGIGVLTDVGEKSTVASITFNGKKYVFTPDSATETIANSQLREEETKANYTTWHQGYAGAQKNAQITTAGLELAGKSQVIRGLNNNSANVKTVNVNLQFAIGEAGYTVKAGTAYFQIPLFFDNGSGVKFATLRNLGLPAGTHQLKLSDDWQSSKDLGSIAANTTAPLSQIIAALGAYKVIGYGVLTNAGESAVVSSIRFAGTTTTFTAPAATPAVSTVVPGSVAPDETEYAGWHQGATPATAASIDDTGLKLGPDRSQVLNGYENNSANTYSGNVDLTDAILGGGYEVVSGDVYFQVPIFFEDAAGDTRFTTLRPVLKGKVGNNGFSLGDQWTSSRGIGPFAANSPVLLGDLLSSIGSYKVLGFGVHTDQGGNGVVRSITWDGTRYVFDRATAKLSVRVSPKPTARKAFWTYVGAKSAGGSVAGDAFTVSYGGKVIGSGKLGSDGQGKVKLSRRLSKGKRTLVVNYLGGTTTKPAKQNYVVYVKS